MKITFEAWGSQWSAALHTSHGTALDIACRSIQSGQHGPLDVEMEIQEIGLLAWLRPTECWTGADSKGPKHWLKLEVMDGTFNGATVILKKSLGTWSLETTYNEIPPRELRTTEAESQMPAKA